MMLLATEAVFLEMTTMIKVECAELCSSGVRECSSGAIMLNDKNASNMVDRMETGLIDNGIKGDKS